MIRANPKKTIKLLMKIILFYFIFSFNSYSDNLDLKENLIVLGSDDAKIKIKVFSSFTCPHCASFHIKIIPRIKEEYIDNNMVQLIFIDFPLDAAALNASKLLHCVKKKNRIKCPAARLLGFSLRILRLIGTTLMEYVRNLD